MKLFKLFCILFCMKFYGLLLGSSLVHIRPDFQMNVNSLLQKAFNQPGVPVRDYLDSRRDSLDPGPWDPYKYGRSYEERVANILFALDTIKQVHMHPELYKEADWPLHANMEITKLTITNTERPEVIIKAQKKEEKFLYCTLKTTN